MQLIVVSGLPGTGKSSVAEAVGRALGMPVFAKDWLEAALLRSGLQGKMGYAGHELLATLADEKNFYAQERYHKLHTIGMEMLALADGKAVADLEPLRSTVLSSPTPFAVADCAVFDGNGRRRSRP